MNRRSEVVTAFQLQAVRLTRWGSSDGWFGYWRAWVLGLLFTSILVAGLLVNLRGENALPRSESIAVPLKHAGVPLPQPTQDMPSAGAVAPVVVAPAIALGGPVVRVAASGAGTDNLVPIQKRPPSRRLARQASAPPEHAAIPEPEVEARTPRPVDALDIPVPVVPDPTLGAHFEESGVIPDVQREEAE